jgi:hypothetical protein
VGLRKNGCAHRCGHPLDPFFKLYANNKKPVSITANLTNNECTFYDCKGSALI